MDAKERKVIRKLKSNGYTNIIVVKDGPNKIYKKHFHTKGTKFFILKGSMKLVIEGTAINCTSGDAVLVPKRATHSAVVGRNGIEFIEGRK